MSAFQDRMRRTVGNGASAVPEPAKPGAREFGARESGARGALGSPATHRPVLLRPARQAPAAPAASAPRQRLGSQAFGDWALGGRTFGGWRPLLWFWTAILAAAATGGTALHYLGPPANRSAKAVPAPEPRAAIAAAPPATVPPATVPSPPRPVAALEAVRSGPLPAPAPSGDVIPARNAPAGAGGAASESAVPASASPASAMPANVMPEAAGPPERQARPWPLIVVYSPRPDGDQDAAQLASRTGVAADQIATEIVPNPPQRAIIRFYAPADHPLARRIGRELAQMKYSWQIENLSPHHATIGEQPLQVWLPRR